MRQSRQQQPFTQQQLQLLYLRQQQQAAQMSGGWSQLPASSTLLSHGQGGHFQTVNQHFQPQQRLQTINPALLTLNTHPGSRPQASTFGHFADALALNPYGAFQPQGPETPWGMANSQHWQQPRYVPSTSAMNVSAPAMVWNGIGTTTPMSDEELYRLMEMEPPQQQQRQQHHQQQHQPQLPMSQGQQATTTRNAAPQFTQQPAASQLPGQFPGQFQQRSARPIIPKAPSQLRAEAAGWDPQTGMTAVERQQYLSMREAMLDASAAVTTSNHQQSADRQTVGGMNAAVGNQQQQHPQRMAPQASYNPRLMQGTEVGAQVNNLRAQSSSFLMSSNPMPQQSGRLATYQAQLPNNLSGPGRANGANEARGQHIQSTGEGQRQCASEAPASKRKRELTPQASRKRSKAASASAPTYGQHPEMSKPSDGPAPDLSRQRSTSSHAPPLYHRPQQASPLGQGQTLQTGQRVQRPASTPTNQHQQQPPPPQQTPGLMRPTTDVRTVNRLQPGTVQTAFPGRPTSISVASTPQQSRGSPALSEGEPMSRNDSAILTGAPQHIPGRPAPKYTPPRSIPPSMSAAPPQRSKAPHLAAASLSPTQVTTQKIENLLLCEINRLGPDLPSAELRKPPRPLVQGPLTWQENYDAAWTAEIAKARHGRGGQNPDPDFAAPVGQSIDVRASWTDELEKQQRAANKRKCAEGVEGPRKVPKVVIDEA